MPTTDQRRHSLEELARLGDEIYDRRVKPAVRPEDDGKYVAIEVDGGEYEIDADDYTAITRLRTRIPTADIWLARIGRSATCRIGGGRW